jgi:hypothetical protein
MTLQEWQALIELLNRAPITQAEKLWLQELIDREIAKLKSQEKQDVTIP